MYSERMEITVIYAPEDYSLIVSDIDYSINIKSVSKYSEVPTDLLNVRYSTFNDRLVKWPYPIIMID